MYLIHTPFGVPETDGDFQRHANGDIVLDIDTNHIETWKVKKKNFEKRYQSWFQKLFSNFQFDFLCLKPTRKWKKWSRSD